MEQTVETSATVKDPVCGMNVVPGRARGWDYLYEKVVYHFCGPDCRTLFQADPKAVLAAMPGQFKAPTPPVTSLKGPASWWHALRDVVKKWRASWS